MSHCAPYVDGIHCLHWQFWAAFGFMVAVVGIILAWAKGQKARQRKNPHRLKT